MTEAVQTAIAGAVVAGAALYLVRRAWRALAPGGRSAWPGSSNGGCDRCRHGPRAAE